jgi:hypothetical protein
MTEKGVIKSQKKSKVKIGDEFGRWTVLENLGIIKACTHFKCECKCGNIRTMTISNLRSGHTKSCGCLKREKSIMHGMTKTPEYDTWASMIQRCYNPNNPAYKNYGERGIAVCTEWLNSFIAFFKDMGERPEGLSIDRIKNDLGYFKENCRWATRIEQNRNCRGWKKATIGMLGISWNKNHEKYRVHITANYKYYHIGLFKNLEDAKAARIAAEKKYWK